MKRILKFKKIKTSNNTKKAKKKKQSKNKSFLKKFCLKIGSPHNINDYLINENSSPFWDDENDEDSISIKPYPFINFSGQIKPDLDFVDKEMPKNNAQI